MADTLRNTFTQAREAGRAAFVGFITAGYPTLDNTVEIMLGMQRGGTDIIELGVPFTDPLAGTAMS
eukprot:6190558-Pleurochrysis_carterae.AAC.1